MDRDAKSLAPGSLVEIADDRGNELASGFFSPRSLIAARVMGPARAVYDEAFFRERFERASALRDRLYRRPFYRLVHAEADFCPSLAIDRFDDVFVAQSGTAGMDALLPVWLPALSAVFSPRAVILKSDSPSRAHEGLGEDVRVCFGSLENGVEVEEAGVVHAVDPVGGQKTGWFYDQRANREFLVSLSEGTRLLDAYAYTGALAIAALMRGAHSAVFLDSSERALAAASATAGRYGLLPKCEFRRADVMQELEEFVQAAERFDIVSCDPPPFVRARKDLESGARGYRKLARLAAQLVSPGGFLHIASCSHAISAERFRHECVQGITRTGRVARLIREAGASPDHPVHPLLPETAYLKSLVFHFD